MNQKTFSYDYMGQTVCDVFEQMINNKQRLDTKYPKETELLNRLNEWIDNNQELYDKVKNAALGPKYCLCRSKERMNIDAIQYFGTHYSKYLFVIEYKFLGTQRIQSSCCGKMYEQDVERWEIERYWDIDEFAKDKFPKINKN